MTIAVVVLLVLLFVTVLGWAYSARNARRAESMADYLRSEYEAVYRRFKEIEPMSHVEERSVWVLRDLIHHYGEHHPSVKGTVIGQHLSDLGRSIPGILGATDETHDAEANAEALNVFHACQVDFPVTLAEILTLAGRLMNPHPDDELPRRILSSSV